MEGYLPKGPLGRVLIYIDSTISAVDANFVESTYQYPSQSFSRVSDTLKAELGAMVRRFQSEDEWLQGVRAHLKKIADAPAGYVGSWDLENEESVTATMIRICAAEL